MLSLTIVFDVLSMRMEIWGRIAGMFSVYTYLLWVPEVTSEIHSAKNRVILNTANVLYSAAYMMIVLVCRRSARDGTRKASRTVCVGIPTQEKRTIS